MYQGQQDLAWLVPLFLAGFVLGAAARRWWFVSQDMRIFGIGLNPRGNDFRSAAFATCAASWLLALASLGFCHARL